MTIESPDIYAEAGLAFFNTCGRLANSRIGTIKSDGGPYTYGVLMTNSLQGAEAGIRREVTIEKSIVNGTVLFDDARGADGTATTTVRSGIKAYGNVTGSRVVGSVGYTYGQRGSITGSEITGARDPDRRRDRARPEQPARARLQRHGLQPARRPDQHRHDRGAGGRQLLGYEHHHRPGRDRHRR